MSHGVSSDLIRELASSIVNGQGGACFVGAGLSVSAGAPTWDALVAPLKSQLRPPTSERSPLLLAQFYRNQRGDHALYEYLRNRLAVHELEPTEAHEILCSLPVSVFVTTNYDDLLEATFRRLRVPLHVISDNKEMALWNEREQVQLLKIHGDLNSAETIVLTERDYVRFLLRNSLIKAKLAELFCYRSVVFVGYSLRDPNISLIFNAISYELGELKRPAYMITFESDSHREKEWELCGIRTVRLLSAEKPLKPGARTEALVSFLAELRDEARAADRGGRGVLLVDDDPEVLRALQRSLSNRLDGISVHTADNGYDASILAEKLRPRVMVVDLEMAKMGGLELIAALRKHPDLADIQMIVFTGHPEARKPEGEAELRIAHFVLKDQTAELIAKLRELLGIPETILPPADTYPPRDVYTIAPSAEAASRSRSASGEFERVKAVDRRRRER